jgi:hypothetical protein
MRIEIKSKVNRNRVFSVFLACISILSLGLTTRAQDPPRYKVDPFWPKELPNNWILGRVADIVVDKDDHIWILHSPSWVLRDEAGLAQNPPLSECCRPAPAVIEFDTEGNVLKAWGGRGYVPDWPTQEFGFAVDKSGNVWIGGSWAEGFEANPQVVGPDRKDIWDRQVLKFNSDGKLLLEIGHPTKAPPNNQDTSILGGVSGITVDDAAHEVYFADGALNKRVVVYDSDTGKFKRGWGAYGIPLSEIDNTAKPPRYDPSAPPSKQFRGILDSIKISDDGLVYVADRTADRVQVFTKQGKFVQEIFVAPQTIGRGTAWTLSFSHDPKQKYLLVGDGADCVIWILNRNDGTVVGKFGHRGANAGQFNFIRDMDMDSHGNLYTAEVNTNFRVQRFVLEK